MAGDPLRSIPRCTGQRADPRRASLYLQHTAASTEKAELRRGPVPGGRVTARSRRSCGFPSPGAAADKAGVVVRPGG